MGTPLQDFLGDLSQVPNATCSHHGNQSFRVRTWTEVGISVHHASKVKASWWGEAHHLAMAQRAPPASETLFEGPTLAGLRVLLPAAPLGMCVCVQNSTQHPQNTSPMGVSGNSGMKSERWAGGVGKAS